MWVTATFIISRDFPKIYCFGCAVSMYYQYGSYLSEYGRYIINRSVGLYIQSHLISTKQLLLSTEHFFSPTEVSLILINCKRVFAYHNIFNTENKSRIENIHTIWWNVKSDAANSLLYIIVLKLCRLARNWSFLSTNRPTIQISQSK